MHDIRKLKVLLISPYSTKKVGGIGTWTQNIIEYSKSIPSLDLRFQNTAFFLKSNLLSSFFSRLLIGIIDSVWIITKTIGNILIFRPDCIHYTSSASIALFKDYVCGIVAKLFRINFIIHFRFGRIPALKEKQNWEWKLLCKVVNLASATIVIDLKSYAALRAFKNEIYYIPNPISQELSHLIFDKEKTVKLGKVVFVGHIVASKGVYELVSACLDIGLVKELVLIGPVLSNTKKDLIEIANSRQQGMWLKFRGEVERKEVLTDILDANLLCLPSYTEGFPNVVIEAMALACPVVGTKVGAIEEMLDVKGKNPGGICIQPKDKNSLKEALIVILENPTLANEYGINGRLRVSTKYNITTVFNKYLSVWRNDNTFISQHLSKEPNI